MRKVFTATFSIVAFTMMFFAGAAVSSGVERIICASTTSTQNSGLFEHILPLFQKKTGIAVQVVAVGTGAAIEIGRRGDADVVFVHARDLELEAVKEGHFTDRNDVMYNDFVLIGPVDDPVNARGEMTAAAAFSKVAAAGHLFVSRGDNSGTHLKELEVWRAAGINPQGKDWYLEVGQGMAKAQRIASEKQAYALTDRGTWISGREQLELAVVFEGDPVLFNQYGVMAVNPARHKHVKYEEAMAFIKWLVSDEGQQAIGSFKVKGEVLFHPNAR